MPIDFIEEEAEAPKIDFVPSIDFVPDATDEPSLSLRTTAPEPGTGLPTMAGSPQGIPQAFPVLESRAQANISAQTPELSGAEVEQMLMTPQVNLPNPIPADYPITRGVATVAKSLPEFATAPGAPLIAVAQLIPGVREAVDAVMGAGMVKGAAQMAGDASVTGNREQMTEAVLGGVLGAAALGAPHLAPMIANEVAARRVGRPDLARVDVDVANRMQPRPDRPAMVAPERLIQPEPPVARPQAVEEVRQQSEAQAPQETVVSLESPVRENGGRTSLVLPDGTALVGGRIHAQTYDAALRLRKATEEQLQSSISAFTRPDGTSWDLQGKPVKVSNVVNLSDELNQPKIEGMGGAVPEEFAPTSRTATGIKNATVERERAMRGLPPAIQPARRSFGTVWDEAMARIDREGPAVQDSLIASLKEKPRALTDLEDAMLLHRQIDLQNEYGKATRDLAQAFDDGRLADVEIQKARAGELSDKLLELYNVNKAAGTETGRGLAARRMMANEDFTLARMETEVRSAKGGKPLTDQERTQLQQTASEFERINKDLEAKVAERDKLLSEAQMARSIAEMQAASAREAARIPPQIQRIIERVRGEIKKGADESRKFLAGAQFSLSPEVLYHISRVGADNLLTLGEAGARWTAKMIADIGERVRPYLDEVLAASQKLLDDTTDRVSGKVEATVKQAAKQALNEPATPQSKADAAEAKIKDRVAAGDMQIRPLVQRLARAFVEEGVTDRNVLVDRVHSVLEGIVPDWTKRKTMDAISGYGDIKLLRKDEVSVRLRDLKGQMQQIAKLEDMAARQAPKKTGLERRIPSEAERELIKQVNEAKAKGGYETLDPETQLKSALDTVKTRMRNEIKELERRIKTKDFSKKTKREIELDQQALDLRHKQEQLKQEYHRMVLEKKLAEQPVPQRIYRHGQEVANVWRAIRTSADFSAVLRQGKFTAVSHPIRAAKALPDMFRAFKSDKEAFRIDQEIMARPNAASGLYERSGLYLAERGVPLSRMEEAYMSRWAEKIPMVAGSARAYSTYLNKLRADSFDAMVSALGKNGQVTLPEAKTIANFINVSTGRGSIGIGNQAAVGLNTWFFAPKYVASRFQMLLGQPLYHGMMSGKVGFKEAAQARKMIAQEYGRILGGYAVIYTLAALAGAKVGMDPKSSDFGKFVIGDTRVDPLAGISQVTVLVNRLTSGEKTTLSGKTVPLRGDVPYGGETAQDVMSNFLRAKLAPLPGTMVDVVQGKDVTGQPIPTEPLEFLLRYIGPISMQDIKDTMEEQGVPAGVALQILNMFGEGVQTYEDRK